MEVNVARICRWVERGGILLVIAIACMSSASAQTPTPTPEPSRTPSLERKFLKNILRDQRAIWTSPLHLQKEDAKWLVPLSLSTAALIATDRRTAHVLHDDRTRSNVSPAIRDGVSCYRAVSLAGA